MKDLLSVYIAGPMRGHQNLNKEAFYDTEEFLKEQRIYHPIINPARLDEGTGLSDEELQTPKGLRQVMARDLDALCECDVAYFLMGWEKSEGARVEHSLATMLNLTLIYQ
jgi:hypothetical protein